MSISRERRAAVETTKRRRALSRRMSGVVMPSRRSFAVGSFHWQLRLLPRFPTAGNVPQLFKSLRLQNARGNARSVTAAAINCRLLVSIKFADSLAEFGYINMTRAGDMTLFPFTWRAHVEDLQRGFPFIQFVDAHLPDSLRRKARCMPRFHPADQIASEFCISGPHEQAHDFLKIVIAFHYEKNAVFRIEHPTRPNG